MKTEELRKIVEVLKPAFKTNDIAEFGKYILFLDNKAFVYNGAMAIIVPFESEHEFAVPADEFTKFVERIKSKDIDVTFDDYILVNAGKAKASFAINTDIITRAKELHFDVPETFENLPNDFVKALKFCQYSIGKDKSYENLTYMYVNGNIMASTDNFRVSEYNMSASMQQMMIPKESIKYLIQYNVDSYAIDEGIAYFKNKEGACFITRLGSLLFPDYIDYLEADGEVVEFPNNMIDMVQMASVTVDGIIDIDKTIKIDIADNKIVVSSENEIGRVVVDEDISYDDNISITINPMFLENILHITRKVMICENRVLFEIDNFRHVVALLN